MPKERPVTMSEDRKNGDGGQALLVTSASLPTTATAITLVTTAALGAEQISKIMGVITTREFAVIGFSLLVSIFATWAADLKIVWKFVLTPINFCILTYLCFASLNLLAAASKAESAGAPVTSTYVVRSTPIPGPQP
jgi:hypothetical protein